MLFHCAGGHLLQHQAQGGLADGEDAAEQLHGERHARRHAAEGARHHHGRVQVSALKPRSPDAKNPKPTPSQREHRFRFGVHSCSQGI